MIGKPIEAITEREIQSLIDDGVCERKTLEYKRALPADSKHDKKEFLADVSSFANASGGDIVYGIAEENGIPLGPLEGLDITNPDQEILRLESIIRTGIRPRMPGIRTHAIPLSNSKVVIVLRVPNSWVSPHRVTYEGHDKFYSRASNGKYELDVDELRAAFIASETLTERTRDFRADRIAKIVTGETPVPLVKGPAVAMHLMPISSLGQAAPVDINILDSQPELMPPAVGRSSIRRFNFDGFIAHSKDETGKANAYSQLFRNGILEVVSTTMIFPRVESTISAVGFERSAIDWFRGHMPLLRAIKAEPPILVFITLIGIRGYKILRNREYFLNDEVFCIDRDIIQLPEVITETYDIEPASLLRPAFDALWNACGYPRSLNYNEAGEWTPRR